MSYRFEVALHNAEVRRLVYEGRHHRDYADDWSSTHYIEVNARSALDARVKVQARYPTDRGFVIEAVREA